MLVQEDMRLRTHAQIRNTKHSQMEAEYTMAAAHYYMAVKLEHFQQQKL
jgi:hypothetical protein